MRQFPASPITALIDESPRYNLGESFGRHLSVADVLDPAELADLSLGYGTSAGDAEVRVRVAERHGIPDGQVLLTTGPGASGRTRRTITDEAEMVRYGFLGAAGVCGGRGLASCALRAAAAALAALAAAASAFTACWASCGVIQVSIGPRAARHTLPWCPPP